MRAMKMEHETDPAQLIWKQVGNLDEIELFGNQVLVGVYTRPNKTKSGILLTDATRGEDANQGKAALVLKKGPAAFVPDNKVDFYGQDVSPGDWVSLWVTDGRKVIINGQLCRIVEDIHIRMKIPTPDTVY